MTSEDKSWVFDSLVGFLKGPMWNGPILSFIEQKSICKYQFIAIRSPLTQLPKLFEVGERISEVHIQLHNEYKNLVDYMLGTYMEEMGITPTDFENACSEPSREIEAKLHQTLFEQVWAANDLEIFHRMMIEKNLDLQLQALEMIHNRLGITPQSYVLNFSPKKSKHERLLEMHAVDLPLEEQEIENNALQKLNLQEECTANVKEEISDEAASTDLQAIQKRSDNQEETSTSSSQLELKEAAEDEMKHDSTEVDEIQRRKEYLRSQRDKLVEMKRRERENSLRSTYKNDASEAPRPKTAEAAESIMSGNYDINPKTLELRKALAKRLKEEVIKKN
ncbi:hypothetical protein J437_LFUL003846 [Ladona fulva]|uniref:Cilia- and flagella-associated protein 36 n=1 Tax=Ladona fulva TaxID=123851 RepID=A0A8K0KHG9_LADFU|nr:hypothetical protein J437_LFUL003846 [Ladona fulva]